MWLHVCLAFLNELAGVLHVVLNSPSVCPTTDAQHSFFLLRYLLVSLLLGKLHSLIGIHQTGGRNAFSDSKRTDLLWGKLK